MWYLMIYPLRKSILGMDNLGTDNVADLLTKAFDGPSKLFANMKLNFEGQPMQLLAAMLLQEQEGGGAGVAVQAVPPPIPEPMPKPDQPQDHFSTPPRQQTSDPNAPVFEHDEPLGGSFHASPLRSTQAPPTGCGGKLVKKVKAMEVKLKPKKRKVVVNDSDQDERGEQAVDLDALIALANAAVTVDSSIPPGGPSNDPAASSHI
ncbi:hypothetical protein Tco_1010809, partial [Tanacetum coccineum]